MLPTQCYRRPDESGRDMGFVGKPRPGVAVVGPMACASGRPGAGALWGRRGRAVL
jgi:hypothetical protein